jgi:hypothetical protein
LSGFAGGAAITKSGTNKFEGCLLFRDETLSWKTQQVLLMVQKEKIREILVLELMCKSWWCYYKR